MPKHVSEKGQVGSSAYLSIERLRVRRVHTSDRVWFSADKSQIEWQQRINKTMTIAFTVRFARMHPLLLYSWLTWNRELHKYCSGFFRFKARLFLLCLFRFSAEKTGIGERETQKKPRRTNTTGKKTEIMFANSPTHSRCYESHHRITVIHSFSSTSAMDKKNDITITCIHSRALALDVLLITYVVQTLTDIDTY